MYIKWPSWKGGGVLSYSHGADLRRVKPALRLRTKSKTVLAGSAHLALPDLTITLVRLSSLSHSFPSLPHELLCSDTRSVTNYHALSHSADQEFLRKIN